MRRREGAVLTLPADAIPTLHALAARRTSASGPARVAGSFIVADDTTAQPRWAVTVPPLGEELLAVQPARGPLAFPLAPRGLEGVALAIRFRDTRSRHAEQLIMPVAPDVPAPLLRRAAQPAATISVVLAANFETKGALAALLESLRLQTLGERVEIVAALPDGAEGALQRFFPGRYRLLGARSSESRSARLNGLAAQAGGKLLLMVGANVALHDARTLETLCALADQEKAASAGCVLLKLANPKVATSLFRSGGIVLLREGGAPVLAEPDCLKVYGIATYPVAANSSELFMVRAERWRELGGFDAARHPGEGADFDYGVRAMARGFFHLCTSVVSAELYEAESRAPFGTEALPSAGSAGWPGITVLNA
jgi:hypothetical protein